MSLQTGLADQNHTSSRLEVAIELTYCLLVPPGKGTRRAYPGLTSAVTEGRSAFHWVLFRSTCAQLVTWCQQGSGISGVRSETLVLVDDSQAGDPRFVSMVQQYDLNSVEDSSRQSFTVWPSTTAFIDGGWQTW